MTGTVIKKVYGTGRRFIGGLFIVGALAAPAAVYYAPQYAAFVPVAEQTLENIGNYLVGDNKTRD